MVQVHRVEQAFDDRVAILQTPGAERGIDGRPAGADQNIRGAGLLGCSIAAGHRAVRGEQGGREVEGVAGLDGGHLSNLIALLRRGADTSQALQESEDGLRQALLGDYRGATRGYILRQVHRDGDLADVEGALFLRQVIPVGVRRDDDLPVAFSILAQVEGVLIHLISRVGHEVAVPQQGRSSTQERGLIGGGVQAGESLLRLDSLLQQRIRGGLFEAGKQVRHRLVLLGNARHGHGAGDDAHLVGGVALILCLPEGVLAEPGLQVTVQGRHPRHGLDVLVVQGNPPGGIARRDLGGACGGVSLQ